MTTQIRHCGNGHKPVFYNGVYLYGFGDWTPGEMRDILERYNILIEEDMYRNALEVEKNENYPATWLNWVLSSNHLTREGIEARVHSETIKSGEAKR